MYESFYGFREKPFSLTPDPKYLFLSPRHMEAFAHLEYARRERGGFVVITGDVGAGKTTLARYFLGRLDEGTATAFVLYPAVTGPELLRTILEDFHIPVTGASMKDHVDALHRFLLECRAQSRGVVVVVDEAQDLSAEVLEQLRLISNLETDTEKLIQIILMGQSELQDLLGRHELRQLAQRVTARYHLGPLSADEVQRYVEHRLEVAGGAGKAVFTPGAIRELHRISGGVPRVLNLLCDRTLLAGYVRGSRVLEPALVREAATDVLGRRVTTWLRPALAAVAIAIAALAASVALTTRAAPASTPAPPPAPVSTAAAAVPAAPAADPLESLLLGSAPGAAGLEPALAQVAGAWGTADLQRTPFRTHLDHLRRLDLPVALEVVHPARPGAAWVALLKLDGRDAQLALSGQAVSVTVPQLERLWTRQAVALWRDHDGVAAKADPEQTLVWTRASLTRIGVLRGDEPLEPAIQRFQRDAFLAPDGVVGSRTLLALYAAQPYPRPRLLPAETP
jgi:general secretion pathway protein A